jgi:3-oxoacyl-(acyl-carrier-protein) synthase
MAKFAQYAMAATEEALQDAEWKPESFEQREATVCVRICANLTVILIISIGSLPRIRHWQL